jgi:hypothetical protein
MRECFALITGLMLLFLLICSAAAQNSWQVANRLQIGAEHDDNIYESSGPLIAAFSGRLLFHSRAERAWPRTQLSFAYSGGLQTYPSRPDENKLTNELNAELGWTLNRWCQISGGLQGAIKVFLNGPFDSGTTQSALNLSLQLPHQWTLVLSTYTARLDYTDSDLFDYLSRVFGATLRRRVSGWLIAEGGAQFGQVRYLRPAFDDNSIGIWFPIGDDQRDRQTTVMARAIIGRRFLVNLSGEFQRNTSNSFGYGHNRWRLSLIAALPLAPRWLLRVAAHGQHKKYLEALPPVLPIELDTERNISNYLVADVSYDISRNLGCLVRVSFYDNEGAVREQFYQKTQLFSGFEYRF